MNTYKLFLFAFSFLLLSCSGESERAESKHSQTITFSEHIAPIIFKNCTPCHRPGEAGPFPFLNYRDVRKRAKMIKYVTSIHYMPPWPADKNYRSFANERGLSKEEIELIAAWVDQGAILGDSTMTPSPPVFPKGSQLALPDLILKMPEAHKIKGNNTDNFLVMKIPYEIAHDTFIKLIEFVPGNRELLHHMNGHLISYAEDAKENVFEGKSIVDIENEEAAPQEFHKLLGILNDDGTYPALTSSVCNYLPGVAPAQYPEGIGGYYMTKKGALYINSIHYGPSPIDTTDQSHFNIFFADRKPKRPLQEVILGTLGKSKIEPPLIIPPNEVKAFRTELQTSRDISLLTINPHMHLLGKSFLAYAITPKNDTIPLISIPKWDFRWQFFYTFKHLLKIPAGSRIIAEGVYDNTAENPNNPFDPPQQISERDISMKTTDEMFQLIINYLPYETGDENISLEKNNYPK